MKDNSVSSLHLYVDNEGVIKVIQELPVEPDYNSTRFTGNPAKKNFEKQQYEQALSKAMKEAVKLKDQVEAFNLLWKNQASLQQADTPKPVLPNDTIYPIEGYEVRIEEACGHESCPVDAGCEVCKEPVKIAILSGVSSPDKKVDERPDLKKENQREPTFSEYLSRKVETETIEEFELEWSLERALKVFAENVILWHKGEIDSERCHPVVEAQSLAKIIRVKSSKPETETVLEQEAQAVRFAMYMSGKTTIGDQDYFRQVFRSKHWTTWKIDN